MEGHSYIPFNLPDIGDEEIDEVVATLRSGWLTTGQRAARFEAAFQSYTGCRQALALSSGTAALHLALEALDIGPGDEVITTPITFCATVSSIIHCGATPVLADIGEDGNIDPVCIEKRISPRTRAIIPVHLGGLPCDMAAIWDIAKRYNLSVIEDAAHAIGTLWRGCHIGSLESLSAAVAYSFYATKTITTAEGGMVTTNSDSLAARMRCLSLHGMSKDAWNRYSDKGNWYYEVLEAGYKYNISDVHAALGIHQLRKIEQFVAVRTAYAQIYKECFADMPEFEMPPGGNNARNAWHLFILRLNLDKLSITRGQFIEELRRRNIGTSVHFIPIPLHPFFAPWMGDPRNHCPRALAFYERLVSLPLYPSMTVDQLQAVVKAVKAVVRSNRAMSVSMAGAAL